MLIVFRLWRPSREYDVNPCPTLIL